VELHPQLKQASLSAKTLLAALNARNTVVSNRLLDMGALLDKEACDTFVEAGGNGGEWRALLFEPSEAHIALAQRLIESNVNLKQAAESKETLLAALRAHNSSAANRLLDMGVCLDRESSIKLVGLCGDGGDWRILLFDTSDLLAELCIRLILASPELKAATTSPHTLLAALEASNTIAANRLLDRGTLLDQETCQTFIGSGQDGGWQTLIFNPADDSVALVDRLVESSSTLREAAKSAEMLLAALEARDVIHAANRLMDLGACLDDKTRSKFISSGDGAWRKLLLDPSLESIALADRLMESYPALKKGAMLPQMLLAALDAHQNVAVSRLLEMGAFLDDEASAEFISGNGWRSALLDSSTQSIERTDRLMEVSPELREATKSAEVLLAALGTRDVPAANRLMDLGALLDKNTISEFIDSDGDGGWQKIVLDPSDDCIVLADRLMESYASLKEAALSPQMLLAALSASQCGVAHRLLNLGTILDETTLARFTRSKNDDGAWQRLFFNDSDECVALSDCLMKSFPALREIAVSAETLLAALDARNLPAANRLLDMGVRLNAELLAKFRGSGGTGWHKLLFHSSEASIQLSSRLVECSGELREDAVSAKTLFMALGARNNAAAHRLIDMGARLDEETLAMFIDMDGTGGGWQRLLFSSACEDIALAGRLMQLSSTLKDAATSANTLLVALGIRDISAAIKLLDMGASLDGPALAKLVGPGGDGGWRTLLFDSRPLATELTDRLMALFSELNEAAVSAEALLEALARGDTITANRLMDLGASLDEKAQVRFIGADDEGWRKLIVQPEDDCVALTNRLMEAYPNLREAAISAETLLAALEPQYAEAFDRIVIMGASLDVETIAKLIGTGGKWQRLLFSCDDDFIALTGSLADSYPALGEAARSPKTLLAALDPLNTIAANRLLDMGATLDAKTRGKFIGLGGDGAWRTLLFSERNANFALADRLMTDLPPGAVELMLSPEILLAALEEFKTVASHWLLDMGSRVDEGMLSKLVAKDDRRGGGPWRSLVLSYKSGTSGLVDRMIALHPELGREALITACEQCNDDRRPELVNHFLDGGVPFSEHVVSGLKKMTDVRPPDLAFRDFLKFPGARVHESKHPYLAKKDTYETIHVEGAVALYVIFDERSSTGQSDDYVRLLKRDVRNESPGTHEERAEECWGEEKYSANGRRGNSSGFPGCNGNPPVRIPAEHFVLHFHSTDGRKTEWGYKLVVIRGEEVSFWTTMILDSSCSGLVDRLMELSPELQRIACSEAMLFTALRFLNVKAALRVLELGARLDQESRTALVEAGFHVWRSIMYSEAWTPLVDRLMECYPELRDAAFSTEMLLCAIRDRQMTVANRILDKGVKKDECLATLLATDVDTQGDSKKTREARYKTYLARLRTLVDKAPEKVKMLSSRDISQLEPMFLMFSQGDSKKVNVDAVISFFEQVPEQPIPRRTWEEVANLIQPTWMFSREEFVLYMACLKESETELLAAGADALEEDSAGGPFEVGARVETRRGLELVPGIICRDHGDGIYDVDLDDGDFQSKISKSSIKSIKLADLFDPDFEKLVLDSSPSCGKVVHRLADQMPSLKQPMLTIAVLKANVSASGRLLNLGAVVDKDMRKALLTRAGWKKAVSEESCAGLVQVLIGKDAALGPDAVLNALRSGRYGLALRLIHEFHVEVESDVHQGLQQLRGKTTAWHQMVEEEHPDVCPVIKALSKRLPDLLDIRDGNNRQAYVIGTNEAREAMRVALFCGRYRVSTPLHTSATCRVLVANDMAHQEERLVVVKLMLNQDQYEREVNARQQGLEEDFVVPIVQASDDEEIKELWPESVKKLGYPDYLCGIIMEYADRNLDAIMRQVRSIHFIPG
jgi:Fe2+ transport system protein FeoA